MRFKVCLVALSLTSAVSGCSGVSDDDAGSSDATSPETTYSESGACRSDMQPISDVMEANGLDGLDGRVIQRRFERLERDIDDALAACSEQVERPARNAMYRYSLANAQIQVCIVNEPACSIDDIERSLQRGNTAAAKMRDALAATE